ncbi:MAG: diguanylate cyclase [Anaerolineae bacterium]|nr:MAG: diguanylate cyclase [Anaerolineae bacterium]
MVCAFDAQGRPTIWNRECERITGYTAGEMLGNPQALSYLLPDTTYRQRILNERRIRPNYRNWEWRITTREGAEKIIAWYSAASFKLPNTATTWWQIGVDMSTIIHAQEELKQQYQHIHAQNAILRNTLDGLDALHRQQDIPSLISALANALHTTIPFENLVVLLTENGSLKQIRVASNATEPPQVTPSPIAGLRTLPVLATMLQKGTPLLIPDVFQSQLWQENALFEHVRCWMGAPLQAADALAGVLWLESSQPHTFTEEHLTMLTLFSRYTAQAIRSIQLQREMQLALGREKLLNEATRRISSALDQPLILQTGAQLASELFQADAVCFVLRDPAARWYIAYRRNLPPTTYPDDVLPPQDPLRSAAHTNTSLLIHHYDEHPGANPRWVKDGIKSCMGTPLPGDTSTPLGALYLFRKQESPAFSIQELSTLENLGWQLGIALQNAMLFADERQRADELGALRDTMADLSAQLAMPDLMYAILERAVALLLAHGGELGLYDEERGGLHVVASYNMGDSYVGQFIPIGKGVMGTVLQKGELLMLNDYHAWDNALPGYRNSICRSVIAAPLKARGRLLGVISVVDSRPNRKFAANEVRILNTFAQQAALAVDNVQLFESAYLRAEEAETLREVSLIVAGLLDEAEAIRRILELVGRVITCDSAVVVLQEGDTLRVAGERHWQEAPSMQDMTFDLRGMTPYAKVARTHSPLRIADIATHAPQLMRSPKTSHIRSWLGVPLGKPEHPLGVLAVHSTMPGYFTTAHERMVMAFASHVTVAITNARLYQEAQYLAITDPLTTLYNRRYFFQIALREFERAARHGYPLSILMIDIDFFKSVNDTYGHQAGDEVLREVALACQESVREIDLLARYGGEEFIVLLPDTGSKGAQHVAMRLHQRIDRMHVTYEEQQIHVTVSVGVSSLQKGVSSLDALIAHADAALYHAKQTGRNRVATWESEMQE